MPAAGPAQAPTTYGSLGLPAISVLVTGAGGFLGRHVLNALLSRGDHVVAMTGRRSLDPEVARRCRRVVRGDIRDRHLVTSALAGIDAVCHLAAYIPPRHDDPVCARACLEVNALGALVIAEEAAAAGVGTVVYASSAQGYAPSPEPADEDRAQWPSGRATYYLASKLVGELYVAHVGSAAGVGVVRLRLSSVYGPGMVGGAVRTFLDRALAGQPIVVEHGGLPCTDFVFVRDAAECFARAVHSGEPGAYNVGSGHSCSLAELAVTVKAATASSSPITIQPPTGRQPAGFAPLSVARARAKLAFRPCPLSEGLGAMIDEAVAAGIS